MARIAKESDAEGLIDLFEALDSETEFMFFAPGERTTTVEEQRDRFRHSLGSDSTCLFVVQSNDVIEGFSAGFSAPGSRNSHVV